MWFEEEQSPPRLWTLLAVIPGLVLVTAALSDEPVPFELVAVMVVATLVLGLWLRSLKLVTQVTDEAVTLHLRGLFKSRTIPISSIRQARPRKYRPVWEYGGWGLRYGPKGWAYNIAGNRGVQLEIEGKKPLLIGSGRPEELAEAITSSSRFRPSFQDPVK